MNAYQIDAVPCICYWLWMLLNLSLMAWMSSNFLIISCKVCIWLRVVCLYSLGDPERMMTKDKTENLAKIKIGIWKAKMKIVIWKAKIKRSLNSKMAASEAKNQFRPKLNCRPKVNCGQNSIETKIQKRPNYCAIKKTKFQ